MGLRLPDIKPDQGTPEVVQPSTIPIPHTGDPVPGLDMAALIGIGGLGVWQVGRLVVRRFFKDSTEIAKDRAESNIVLILQEDNAILRKKNDDLQERIDKIAKERNDAVSQLGRFLAESEIYKEKINELQQQVILVTQKLEEQNTLLRSVLIENAELKSQVNHLEQSNEVLSTEMQSLRAKMNKMDV